MRGLIVSLFLGLLLASPVSSHASPLLFAVRPADDTLVSIDTNTLAITEIGPLGIDFLFGGLAYDPGSGTMYMVGGRLEESLYTVNLATGAATFVGLHDVTDIFGLAFDTSTDTLYGSQFASTSLFSLDVGTGAPTLIGSGTVGTIGGLAYDSLRNDLVGIKDGVGGGDLFSINRTTGAHTLLFDGPVNANSGLAYDSDLDLFWSIDGFGNLGYFDPNAGYAWTNVASGLGDHDGLAYVSGAAAVPEPATLLLLGTGFAAAGMRRRVKKKHS